MVCLMLSCQSECVRDLTHGWRLFCSPITCVLVCFQVSKQSFAPCMRHLHESLRKEHHLKHFGRLQYGLFLKSIGLTLDQAMAFWRTEFVKKIEPEKVSVCDALRAASNSILLKYGWLTVCFSWMVCVLSCAVWEAICLQCKTHVWQRRQKS